MKKRILIVNKSFEVGGIQSSMVNMSNELSKFYDVDLFVYNPSGLMKERINENVKIIDSSWCFKSLGMNFRQVLCTGNIKYILFRLFATIWTKLFDNRLPINLAIKYQQKLVGYDLAIAYHQEQRKKSVLSGFSRVVDKCVESKKKIAWLHFDSNMISIDDAYNNQFYDKMDKIICVSKSLMDSFAKKNPALNDKMDFCYNFMLYDSIIEKSLLVQEVPYPEKCFICFSACRLTTVKAITRAIYALAPVFKNNSDVVWYIAGDGPERGKIESAIKECGLSDQIVLIGMQKNPYTYIKNADLTLNVSYNEAAPMIFMESKALGTPIFATCTSSAKELLHDGIDSFICDNSEEGLVEKFNMIINNRKMIIEARENLKSYHGSNADALNKIASWLD